MLAFDCGPLGHGAAGHGHADALSIQLHSRGYPFLVDPGTYSYNLDYELRDEFRSTRSHNTATVDGLDQSTMLDRMAWKTAATARCRRWITTRWFDLVDGEHDGYRRLPNPVTHRRIVLLAKPGAWIICDHFTGRGRHEVELRFHVRPDCALAVRSATEAVLESPKGERLTFCAAAPLRCDATRTWFSPSYGTKIEARALRARASFDGEATYVECFSESDDCAVTAQRAGDGIAISLERDGERTTVFLALGAAPHPEPPPFSFHGDLLYRHGTDVWAAGCTRLAITGVVDLVTESPLRLLSVDDGICRVVLRSRGDPDPTIDVAAGYRVVVERA
jgi:hypothetical protein